MTAEKSYFIAKNTMYGFTCSNTWYFTRIQILLLLIKKVVHYGLLFNFRRDAASTARARSRAINGRYSGFSIFLINMMTPSLVVCDNSWRGSFMKEDPSAADYLTFSLPSFSSSSIVFLTWLALSDRRPDTTLAIFFGFA